MPHVNPRYEISDEEEARIQAGIARDPDNPELTDEQLANLRPARDVLPPDLYAALTKRRTDQSGSQDSVAKEQVTLTLDSAILDYLRASGPGWEDRVNNVLKSAISSGSIPELTK